MNIQYKDFIGIYKNVYPKGYCSHLINEFERLCQNGAGYNRQQVERAAKHEKDDMQLSISLKAHPLLNYENNDSADIFFHGLQNCYDDYVENFSVLIDSKINGSFMKMQRTSPGGGYHIWHGEQSNKETSRVLVYMLYCNTLSKEEAGETEFLYQKIRLQPEENTMIIWPAAFTHAHRGNVVHGNRNKYIVTGWFYYE